MVVECRVECRFLQTTVRSILFQNVIRLAYPISHASSFGFDDEKTETWVASFGSVLKSSSPPTSTFLACYEGAQWVLYLQAGTDVPPYDDCVETELTIGTNP